MNNDTMNKLRREIITCCSRAREGHIASALSIFDILWVLYNTILDVQLDKTQTLDKDRFILSKGHGCMAHYVVLAEKGYFPESELPQLYRLQPHLKN